MRNTRIVLNGDGSWEVSQLAVPSKAGRPNGQGGLTVVNGLASVAESSEIFIEKKQAW